MKGSGKGGEARKGRKKPPRRREAAQPQGRGHSGEGSKGKGKKSAITALANEGKFVRKRTGSVQRLKWVPPQPPALSLQPEPCVWCEKQIKDMSTAITDPITGKPAHFDCTISRIAERETLEKGDAVGYIGGGRFGVLHFSNPQNLKKFKIKKILEWEKNEGRSDWRVALCEHFSVT